MEEFYQYEEEYRDTIATVDAEGKRIWVYPKKPQGYYHNLRIVVTIFLLGLLFAGPFIKIGGQPLLLMNFFERKFIIFGQAFWPQDFLIFGLAMITFFVFIILFTTAFGRLWCGWACPQTLFMEMVFRKIEYLIEGDANQQRKLNAAPWNFDKILRKGGKQLIFLLISVLIGHLMMAYLIGVDQVKEVVQAGPAANFSGFLGLLFFSGTFYGVFAYLREQACIAICPYGRLQGVLLNKDSIVVAYDWLRGEPRGKLKKEANAEIENGDCIDCKLCVHACPTGIDIRNGTQLECVNCTACIDACDQVMTKIDKPIGLIRYDSYNGIEQGKKLKLGARLWGYIGVLTVLLGVLSYLVLSRSDIETTMLRVPGQLFQRTDQGAITNLYNVQFVNKTFDERTVELRLTSPDQAVIKQIGGASAVIPSNDVLETVFLVEIPKSALQGTKTELKLDVYSEGALIDKIETNFLGPIKTSKP